MNPNMGPSLEPNPLSLAPESTLKLLRRRTSSAEGGHSWWIASSRRTRMDVHGRIGYLGRLNLLSTPINQSFVRHGVRANRRVRHAAFRFDRFANGEGALPALMAAHRLRAASTMALRPAALSFRFGFPVALPLAGAGLLCVPGGRPRRFPVIPPRASMA